MILKKSEKKKIKIEFSSTERYLHVQMHEKANEIDNNNNLLGIL